MAGHGWRMACRPRSSASPLWTRLSFHASRAIAMPFRPFSSPSLTDPAANASESESQILVEEGDGVRTAILNRPKALNALNTWMVSRLKDLYQQWEADPNVYMIMIKGNGRAFCAGGDVRSVYNHGIQGDFGQGRQFFWNEYQLNYLVGTIRKPHIAIMNGLCMGGGSGISILGTFRVVTENTLFAMPETAIALHPDVGASFFLSRLPGRLGEFLGLTGMRLDGNDMMAVGLATHAVPSYRLSMLEERLASLATQDLETIDLAIEEHGATPELSPESPLHKKELIDEIFGLANVENIKSALEKKLSEGEEWCRQPLEKINYASPTSLKVTLQSIRDGRRQSLSECLKKEYRLSVRATEAVTSRDLYEGVRALLVDKDNKPNWNPSTLAEVTKQVMNAHFALLPVGEELELPVEVRETQGQSPDQSSKL